MPIAYAGQACSPPSVDNMTSFLTFSLTTPDCCGRKIRGQRGGSLAGLCTLRVCLLVRFKGSLEKTTLDVPAPRLTMY